MPKNIKLPEGEWHIDFPGNNGHINVAIRPGSGPQEIPIGNGPPVIVTNTNTGQTFNMAAGQELRNGAIEVFDATQAEPPVTIDPPPPPAQPARGDAGGGGGEGGRGGDAPAGPIGLGGGGLPVGPALGGLQAGGGGGGGNPRDLSIRIQFEVV